MSVYPARTPSTLNTSPQTAETMIEALTHSPAMIRQPGRHCRSPLLPLASQPRVAAAPETVVGPAEVVDAPDQVHPRGQRARSSGDRPAAAGQWTQYRSQQIGIGNPTRPPPTAWHPRSGTSP